MRRDTGLPLTQLFRLHGGSPDAVLQARRDEARAYIRRILRQKSPWQKGSAYKTALHPCRFGTDAFLLTACSKRSSMPHGSECERRNPKKLKKVAGRHFFDRLQNTAVRRAYMPEAEEGRSCRILSKAKELAACSSQAASPFDGLVSLVP